MVLQQNWKKNFQILYQYINNLMYKLAKLTQYYVNSYFKFLIYFIKNFYLSTGVLSVVAVCLLTTTVVVLWYMFVLPVIRTYSINWILYHIIVAHYLLINIVFHYFKAVFTHPGSPPQLVPLEYMSDASVCKKCMKVKPPRAHHCSTCNQCFLKMDHHCPWMNNCIGFFNHRYFISFCIFMWLGTIYVTSSTLGLFLYHVNHLGTQLKTSDRASSLSFMLGLGPILDGLLNKLDMNNTVSGGIENIVIKSLPHPGGFQEVHAWEQVAIVYLFALCFAVTVALTALNAWHVFAISQGQTSIEVRINNAEVEKAAIKGMRYNNPYHHGWKENFRMLFGLQKGRTILSVLLPSSHKPTGDGLSWSDNKKPIYYTNPMTHELYQRNTNKT